MRSERFGPGSVRNDRYGPAFWVFAAMGWAVMVFGAWTLVQRSGATHPANFAGLLIGLLLAHDLVVAPAVLLFGRALARRVSPRRRAGVQAALIVSAILALFSIPMVFGLGGLPLNPTLLPRNYAAGLAICLVAVWGAMVVLLVAGSARARRSGSMSGRSG